ncbi:MAG: leucine-rich repeat domain-containing protein [Oscillospiraceae bacterium]|nr:leucine-rich repeat domain-containing protein [Oscillospiraceae bacterium]
MTGVVLPETIEFIDYGAFIECEYLENVNFPQSLKYIGGCAFAYCDSLKEISIDCPELTLSECSFSPCRNLTDVSINAEVIGERAFENCTALENVTFGENIQKQ